MTPADVLARRTRLAFLNSTAARLCLPRVVEIMAEAWQEVPVALSVATIHPPQSMDGLDEDQDKEDTASAVMMMMMMMMMMVMVMFMLMFMLMLIK